MRYSIVQKLLFIVIISMFAVSLSQAGTPNTLERSFAGICEICGDVEGVYYHIWDAAGHPATVFKSADGDWVVLKKGEHGTFIVKPTDSLPDVVPSELLADVQVLSVSDEVIISTNKPIIVKLVNIATAEFISNEIFVIDETTINISDLNVGCRYAVAIYQEIEGVGRVSAGLHLFCK